MKLNNCCIFLVSIQHNACYSVVYVIHSLPPAKSPQTEPWPARNVASLSFSGPVGTVGFPRRSQFIGLFHHAFVCVWSIKNQDRDQDREEWEYVVSWIIILSWCNRFVRINCWCLWKVGYRMPTSGDERIKASAFIPVSTAAVLLVGSTTLFFVFT